MKSICLIFIFFYASCRQNETKKQSTITLDCSLDSIENITNLRRGDLLIKPNNNWLNGSSLALGGDFFGHAAIVLNNITDPDINSLLEKTLIFESVAKELPTSHQNRIISALVDSPDSLLSNYSFAVQGSRYRLRPNLEPELIDSIIKYILDCDDGQHSWRAVKNYDSSKGSNRKYWYCSLLIWQAYYDLANIDIDCNKGFIIFPNDLINHPMFDGMVDGEKARIRF